MLTQYLKPDTTCVISVLNLEKAIGWYQQVLGCEVLYQIDDIRWAEMKTHHPGLTIGLQEVESFTPTEDTTLTFTVTDMAAVKAELDKAQVKTGEISEISGMVKLMMFYDPFGNGLMFAEMLS